MAACAIAIIGAARSPAGAVDASRSVRPASARLLFSDDFRGRTLDPRIWYRCFSWANEHTGCSNGPPYDLEWYEFPNVSVDGGQLELTALKQPDDGYDYTSGMAQSGPTPHRGPGFAYLYGYAEMRAQFPPGHGMWPAFWMLPVNGSWPPEIDAMEWQGATPRFDYATFHWVDAHGKRRQSGTAYDTGMDLSTAPHVYGVDWQPRAITWYFDGAQIKRYTDARFIPNVPMYLIVDLAVGGWISFPNRHTHFPATMSIDYVRVWSRKPG